MTIKKNNKSKLIKDLKS